MTGWHFVDPPRRRGMSATSSPGFIMPTTSAQNVPYDAGITGNRRLRIWRPPNSGPNVAVARDIITIRGRARAAARNDPWAGSALDRSTWNGIGTGIQAKMVNGTEEQKAFIADLWGVFIEESDADGMLDLYGQQGISWTEWHEGGEVFARLRPRRLSDGLAVPLQVQLLEAEMCPNDLFQIASNGNEIRYGIEFNAIGRRVAFWFYREHPGDFGFTRNISGQLYTRVPASQVVHLYRPMRIGQHRGIPDAVSVLLRMFNMDTMDDAVLERQKIANLFAGFLEQSNDEEPNDAVVNEWASGTSGEAPETDDDDVPMPGLEPGTFSELPPGYKATFTEPPTAGAEYWAYMRGHLLAVAARYGVPYELLTGDLKDISDRTLRLILNEFRRGLEMKQWQFFIPQWCKPIRAAFWEAAYLGGRLDALFPDYAERRRWYQRTLWVPQGWPYSHPVQDVDADRKAIRAGLASPIAKILSTGEDPEQVLREYSEFNRLADAAGLVFDSDPRRTNGAGSLQAPAAPGAPGANAPEPPDMTREEIDEAEAAGDLTTEEADEKRAEIEAYGVAVRAGVVTPQTADEDHFRKRLGLPGMGDDARRAWKDSDKGVRRPVTLTPPGQPAKSPQQQQQQPGQKQPPPDEQEDQDDA